MVANSQLNPNVLTIAVAAIAVFIAIFYKKYQWEMHEQQYKELMAKKKSAEKKQQAANQASEQSI
jgi:mannose/fructose/N-acetylgalactosamine-specific phosphotransferase system component IIC